MEVVLIIIMTGLVILAIKIAMTNPKESSNASSTLDDRTSHDNERLPNPGKGYFYYELTGMQYRGLNTTDFGIHDGYAEAEMDNKYDKCAVGIHRSDNDKLIAYIRKEQNKDLHKLLLDNNRSTHATFRIWSRGEQIYGCAFVKEEITTK